MYSLREPGTRGPTKLTVTNVESLRTLRVQLRLSFDVIARIVNERGWHDPSI